MQIVTDSAADLTTAQLEELGVYSTPLNITLMDKTYRSGIDIQPVDFYHLMEESGAFPTTSQPSAGDFAELYRRLAATDPEILSIHVSSGLSGTLNAARSGAAMVPEARVTFFDSLTLSSPLGWMVKTAAHARGAGWPVEKIVVQLGQMHLHTQGLFTLNTLKYLAHGGRISHIKSLMAAVLNIKPIIGPEKQHGIYATYAQEMSWKRAIQRVPDVTATFFKAGQDLRVQLLHGNNPEAVEILKEAMQRKFNCQFDPVSVVAPVLGAHTGSSLVGLSAGAPEVFADLF